MRGDFVTRKTRLEDLLAIEVQEAQRFSDPRGLLPFTAEALLIDYLGAYSWTLEHDGIALVCIGVVPRWTGVASCWGLFSEAALGHAAALARFARGGIEAAETKLDLRRIETTAPRTHTTAHRWLRHLGFQREGEGIARAYGLDGSDHIRFERVH